ncbi:HGGxSTG domain-containing protein [Bradyrhizobium viridifuturi]|uniref:HGGxSTG domain-containing protein n=1 Tax=Bradyrhizobium viridifuturi TaxID=1654716 RepID=UPI00067F5F3B|nr:HGGxSTG domain-containing protein [Bradyrhizobium viridifuturi]
MSDPISTTGPMQASPRCGAKTRTGDACRAPAVRGKRRCRMHGGAKGSGAPKANRNARKHGLFTRDAIAERTEMRALLGEARKLIEGMKSHRFARTSHD